MNPKDDWMISNFMDDVTAKMNDFIKNRVSIDKDTWIKSLLDCGYPEKELNELWDMIGKSPIKDIINKIQEVKNEHPQKS